MKALAIDTATEACSVALYDDGSVLSKFELCPQQHSQRLLPMVDEILAQAQYKLSDLDGLVFGRGPGSFTGVRIATGMIQGLALATELPVVGVSTLAAMAQQAFALGDTGVVAAAIDARMSEVYFGLFACEGGLAVAVEEEQVCAPDLAAEMCRLKSFHAVGTGWQAYPALEQINSHSVEILYPAAEYMLPLGIRELEQGGAKDVESITPVYLRDKVTWKKLPGRE
ncbi:tRNA (adenosine(37)-N6)-threonylcarbamoyltransferase complex dimerization subunit type 1 TsaB [Alteromonas aestuariivivens]|uniref:tRNA threonylcarbamoyladenosine biosynthesis protein TsaB n=1 Tax=Alteromonas aestuariivivens TaxID=1938339 RepID=A0A3D8M4H6_9ALTE|nr:tRNA (adenosine(37)-N6)-threonylcarbamoyltransferase complex dimerization subunit type 1 TsaB [Alteromonas aestuariivivens]RDV24647.1 tRNA (adenosine(37)-N6)-threonylcarbamoyltransferase complex dimerization subunit type 1 TsaB [Alteromonas aestuariivivens]